MKSSLEKQNPTQLKKKDLTFFDKIFSL